LEKTSRLWNAKNLLSFLEGKKSKGSPIKGKKRKKKEGRRASAFPIVRGDGGGGSLEARYAAPERGGRRHSSNPLRRNYLEATSFRQTQKKEKEIGRPGVSNNLGPAWEEEDGKPTLPPKKKGERRKKRGPAVALETKKKSVPSPRQKKKKGKERELKSFRNSEGSRLLSGKKTGSRRNCGEKGPVRGENRSILASSQKKKKEKGEKRGPALDRPQPSGKKSKGLARRQAWRGRGKKKSGACSSAEAGKGKKENGGRDGSPRKKKKGKRGSRLVFRSSEEELKRLDLGKEKKKSPIQIRGSANCGQKGGREGAVNGRGEAPSCSNQYPGGRRKRYRMVTLLTPTRK